jgi:hypothetical protein
VRRWYAGDAVRDAAAVLEPLAAALDSVEAEVREGYRALTCGRYRGRRVADLVRGVAGVRGVVSCSADLAGDYARDDVTPPPGVRTLDAHEVPADVVAAWMDGRAELPADVVATLGAILPAMRRGWTGGAAGARAELRAKVARAARDLATREAAAGRELPDLDGVATDAGLLPLDRAALASLDALAAALASEVPDNGPAEFSAPGAGHRLARRIATPEEPLGAVAPPPAAAGPPRRGGAA